MAWTNFPVAVGDDVQSYLVWTELIKAIYERQQILGTTPDILSSIDNTATGTVSVSTSSTAVSGTGTQFTAEYSVGDMIWLQFSTTRYPFVVASITDDTNLTIDRAYPFNPSLVDGSAWRLPGMDFFRDEHITSMRDAIEGLFGGAGAFKFIDHTDNGGDWDGVTGGAPRVDLIPPWTFGDDGAHDITKPTFANIARNVGAGTFWSRTIERTGTIKVNNGSQTINGTGTSFLTEYSAGDTIWIKGEKLEVLSVTDNVFLSLTANWTDPTEAGLRHFNASQVGAAATGDVFSLEIVNEMFRVINLLKWTRSNASLLGTAGTTGQWDRYSQTGDAGPPADPTAAYNDFVSKWAHSWGVGITNLPAHGVTLSLSPLPSTSSSAAGRVDRLKLRVNKGLAVTTEVDWYVWPSYFSSAGTQQFDDKGFGLTRDAWNRYVQTPGSASAQITTSFIFDDTTVPAKPTVNPGPGTSSDRGFGIALGGAFGPAPAAGPQAVVKWIGLTSY